MKPKLFTDAELKTIVDECKNKPDQKISEIFSEHVCNKIDSDKENLLKKCFKPRGASIRINKLLKCAANKFEALCETEFTEYKKVFGYYGYNSWWAIPQIYLKYVEPFYALKNDSDVTFKDILSKLNATDFKVSGYSPIRNNTDRPLVAYALYESGYSGFFIAQLKRKLKAFSLSGTSNHYWGLTVSPLTLSKAWSKIQESKDEGLTIYVKDEDLIKEALLEEKMEGVINGL